MAREQAEPLLQPVRRDGTGGRAILLGMRFARSGVAWIASAKFCCARRRRSWRSRQFARSRPAPRLRMARTIARRSRNGGRSIRPTSRPTTAGSRFPVFSGCTTATNTFGSNPLDDIVLPAPVPAEAGTFEFHSGKTIVHMKPGVTAMMHGAQSDDRRDAPRFRRPARDGRSDDVRPCERRALRHPPEGQEQQAAQGFHRPALVPGRSRRTVWMGAACRTRSRKP